MIFVVGSAIVGATIGLNAVSVHATCTAVFVAVSAILGFMLASVRTLGKVSWLGWVGLFSILAAIFIGWSSRSPRPSSTDWTMGLWLPGHWSSFVHRSFICYLRPDPGLRGYTDIVSAIYFQGGLELMSASPSSPRCVSLDLVSRLFGTVISSSLPFISPLEQSYTTTVVFTSPPQLWVQQVL
jgi:hypothetical protein